LPNTINPTDDEGQICGAAVSGPIGTDTEIPSVRTLEESEAMLNADQKRVYDRIVEGVAEYERHRCSGCKCLEHFFEWEPRKNCKLKVPYKPLRQFVSGVGGLYFIIVVKLSNITLNFHFRNRQELPHRGVDYENDGVVRRHRVR